MFWFNAVQDYSKQFQPIYLPPYLPTQLSSAQLDSTQLNSQLSTLNSQLPTLNTTQLNSGLKYLRQMAYPPPPPPPREKRPIFAQWLKPIYMLYFWKAPTPDHDGPL